MRYSPWRSVVALLVLAFVGSALSFPPVVKADETASWRTSPVSVTKIGDTTAVDFNETKIIPCTKTTSHKKMWASGWHSYLKDSSYAGCLVPMLDGYVDTNNLEILPYGGKYNYLLSNDGTKYGLTGDFTMVPAPNTSQIAFVASGYPSSYLYITNNYRDTFADVRQDNATNIVLVRNKDFDFTLKNDQGTKIGVSSGTIVYSSNGQWMVVSANNTAWLRVNLHSGNYEILPFAAPKPYGGYASSQAVSSDGRFVAIFEPYNSLKVYDLEACQQVTGTLTSRNCQAYTMSNNTLKSRLQAQQVFLKGLRFASPGAIEAYVSATRNGIQYYETYRISIPETEPPVRYLALGDSFSSGEGTFDYIGETNFYTSESEYNLCHLSGASYPYLLHKVIPSTWFGSVACSGAESNEVVSTYSDKDFLAEMSRAQASFDEQADASQYIKTVKDNKLPGYIPQNSIVAHYSPTLATITIGGNDVGFGNIVAMCITQPGCFSGRAEREAKADEISSKILSMSAKLRVVRESMAGPSPKLYVLGYPKITTTTSSLCSLIGYDERLRLDALVEYLNESIKIAAHNAGAIYVDLSSAFVQATSEDHRICGNAPLAANGFVAAGTARSRQSTVRPGNIFGSESYHPNVLGHELLADTIRSVTNDFKLSASTNLNPIVKPDNSFYERFVGDLEDMVNTSPTYSALTQYEAIQRGGVLGVTIQATSSLLASSTGSAVVELHSDPTMLGTASFTPAQGLTSSVTIPPTVEPGWHELHVLYTDIEGRDVDLYQYIYVIGNNDDYDGDGITNDQEPCAIGGILGVDRDEDGIDDACDSSIQKTIPAQPEDPDPILESDNPSEEIKDDVENETTTSTQNITSKDSMIVHNVFHVGSAPSLTWDHDSVQPQAVAVLGTGGAIEQQSDVTPDDSKVPFYSVLLSISAVIATVFVGYILRRKYRQ